MRRLAFAIVVVLIAATPRPAASDQWARSFPITGKPTVRMRVRDGGVHVSRAAGREVTVLVTTLGWRIAPGHVTVTTRQNGDQVEVEVRQPNPWFQINFVPRSIRIELKVPAEADLDLRTGDGGVEVEPLAGEVSIVTGDGHIALEGVRGRVHLESGDGHIEATGMDGSLEAHTGDGRIHVGGRFDALHLESGDGRVIAEAREGSRIGDGWSVTAGDGPVTLRIPAGLSASLDAHTGDGGISLDLPVTVSGDFGRHTLRGTLNGGGATLTLRTGDGGIRIEKSE